MHRFSTTAFCPAFLLLAACQSPTAEPGTLRAPSGDRSLPGAEATTEPTIPELAPSCEVDADCAARLACTVGACEAGACVQRPAAAGTACEAGACDGTGRCAEGAAGLFVKQFGKGVQETHASLALGEAFDHEVIAVGTFDDQLGREEAAHFTKGARDGFVRRLTTTGAEAWTEIIGGTGDLQLRDATLDAEGNTIVVGCTDGDLNLGGDNLVGSDRDAFFARYAPDGTLVDFDRIGGIGRQCFDRVAAFGTRFVVAGTFDGELGIGDALADAPTAFVASLDGGSGRNWMTRLSGDVDVASVEAASDGSVYVSGSFFDGMTVDGQALFGLGGRDGYVARLGPGGDTDWLVGVGGTGDDRITAATATREGLAIAGTFEHPFAVGSVVLVGGPGASFVAGLTDDGDGVWAEEITPGSGDVTIADLAYDPQSDAIVATGSVLGFLRLAGTAVSANSEDGWAAKLAYDGTPLWLRQIGGEGTQRPTSVAVGDDGQAWIAGHHDDAFNPPETGYDPQYGWTASFGF